MLYRQTHLFLSRPQTYPRVSLYRNRLRQGVVSNLGLMRFPWQRISPSTFLRRFATASATALLKSKSPARHSPLWQTNENADLACSTLTLYLTSPVLVKPSGSK